MKKKILKQFVIQSTLCVLTLSSVVFAKVERVPGELIVKIKKNASGPSIQAAAISALEQSLGAGKILNIAPFQTDAQYNTIRLTSDRDLQAAIKALQSNPMVEFAEPNTIQRIFDFKLPNDPHLEKLWGLRNVGQKDPKGKDGVAGVDVKVLPLWEAGFTGSRDILVAVIDTGVLWDHPDLKSNIYTNPGEAGELAQNGKDDDGNGFVDDVHGYNFSGKKADSNDDHGHGTHCAGTIGADGNNGEGVVGVNWQVSILPVKFLSASGSGTTADAIESVKYATKMKVQIMSNSWGGGGFSQGLKEAIEEARDAGILFVAAAGNNSSDNDAKDTYPAGYDVDNIVAVAAIDNQGTLASFSNYGKKKVHVAAPGVNVYSTVLDGKYESYSGTSMACPHVAGAAALLLSTNKALTYAQLKERLIKSSEPVKGLKNSSLSKGRINLDNAWKEFYPPSNEPDPTLWKDQAMVLESEHPYKNGTKWEQKIDLGGAKHARVHFSKIDVESGYDFIEIVSSTGEVVDKISGELTDYTSEYVDGGSITIRFSSDNMVSKWGFAIDKVQFISETLGNQ